MPYGPGTYGNKVGRPPKKKATKKKKKVKKNFMYLLRLHYLGTP